MIVVDASVAVKWFLKEPYSEEAITLVTCAQKLVGPTLANYEVAGAFIRALRRKDIDEATTISSCDRWLQTIHTNVMQLSFDQADVIRGTSIAVQLNHALADCIYLAMAERLGGSLITADEVFFDKAKKSFDQTKFIANIAGFVPEQKFDS